MTESTAVDQPLVWVTGASRGLGATLASNLAGGGHAVVGFGRTAPEAPSPFTEFCVMNLDDERSVEGVVDELLGSGSSPDALVMNATWHGGGTTGSGLGVQLDAAVGTTLAGHIQILSAVAPLMARRRRGRVVFIGSVGATFGGRDEAAYTAAKSGLVGLMRTVARELGGRGVTANLVAPGPMDSEAFGDRPLRWRRRASAAIPAQRPATCREVSAVVEFLLSDRAASITGQVLAVDGGLAAAMAP